jgi:hypothetical protein
MPTISDIAAADPHMHLPRPHRYDTRSRKHLCQTRTSQARLASYSIPVSDDPLRDVRLLAPPTHPTLCPPRPSQPPSSGYRSGIAEYLSHSPACLDAAIKATSRTVLTVEFVVTAKGWSLLVLRASSCIGGGLWRLRVFSDLGLRILL